MTQKRTARSEDQRESGERMKEWVPPGNRYTLENTPEFNLRWVRTAMSGQDDHENVERRLEEGFEIVKPDDPVVADKVAKGQLRVQDGKIVRQGLVLMKMDKELVSQRQAYYTNEADLHQQSVSSALNRVRDSSMPLTEEFERR